MQKAKKIRLQANLEFRQNEIKKLNKKHNIEMFSIHVRGEKAYTAKQKIREFKKLLFWSKLLHKASFAKRFNSRKLIRLAVENINSINSHKYGYASNAIEAKEAENERFREIYDFYRLVKEKQHAERYKHADAEKDKKLCRENFSKLLENASLIRYTIKLVDDSTYLTKNLEIADAFIDNITKMYERKNIFLKDGKIS